MRLFFSLVKYIIEKAEKILNIKIKNIIFKLHVLCNINIRQFETKLDKATLVFAKIWNMYSLKDASDTVNKSNFSIKQMEESFANREYCIVYTCNKSSFFYFTLSRYLVNKSNNKR